MATVPNVPQGAAYVDAVAALAGESLPIGPPITEPHSTVPAGNFVRFIPAGGTTVAAHSYVVIVTSSGLPQVTVPTVAEGSEVVDAMNALTGANLVPGPITGDNHPTVPVGKFIRFAQTGNVNERTPVGIVVSNGPGTTPPAPRTDEWTRVPDSLGGGATPDTDAERLLRDAGLQLGRFEATKSRHPSGMIDRTDPPIGSRIRRGRGVTVFVSNGESPDPSIAERVLNAIRSI